MKLIILAFSEPSVCFSRDFLGKRFLRFIRLVLSPFKFEVFFFLSDLTVILSLAERGEGEQKRPSCLVTYWPA